MAKGTERFKETIKKHLDGLAAADSAFAEKYAAEGKTLDGCVEYILGQVQKSGCAGFADEEIYGMAVHYYDESDLGDYPKVSSCNVIVNHRIELTEEEKAEARKKALESYEAAERKKLEDKERKRLEAEKKKAEEAREKAKAVRESEGTGSLFDF